jgi:surfeit locus 1 family protein
MTQPLPQEATTRRSPVTRAILGILMLVLFAGFSALGIWQIERLSWKLDLIARVDARVHATPTAPPTREQGDDLDARSQEYLHVRATGIFDYSKDSLVQASTELGPGYWVMTPLTLTDGSTILVNRGFVPNDKRQPADRKQSEIAGTSTVTGLLRLSEPKGAFLRSNDPTADRWFSRDVAAIAEQQGITNVVPYFIDADSTPNQGGLPVGGLTVIRFANNHLAYAVTWFALALMVAGAAIYIVRSRARQNQ